VPSPAGRPGVCPRCGERLPFASVAANGPAPPVPAAGPAPLGPVERAAERMRGWSRRSTALLVLGVMVLMATAGLILALLTKGYRRANDHPQPPDERASRVRVVAPADLGGLGYLPPSTDVVIGLHVAEAMQDPAGRAFLGRFHPADLWRGRADNQPGLDTGSLEQWTGLSLDDIDHVVVGLTTKDRLIPRLVLVVQTRGRYDAEKVRAALKASRSPEPGRLLYRFQLQKPPLEAVLWFAAERTLLVGLSPEDLQEVPDTPRPGVDHLAAPLQMMLKERMASGGQVWVIGHADDWDKTSARLLLAGMSKEGRQALENVRTFGAWLQFGEGLTLNESFRCRDARSAEELERYLVPPEEERKPIKLLGGRPEMEAVARELARTLKAARQDEWVTVQAKANADTVRQALERKEP
jgi:hypothetical protein